MTTTTRVRNVCEFLKWVAEVRDSFDFADGDRWGPWFRGQASATWDLRPKLYRPEYGTQARRREYNIENEIREEFAVRAPSLCEGVPAPHDDWGWYFLMQHYGAPTRLLDWTEVPLLGLYFAVNDNDGLEDAEVWALDPYELNRRVTGDWSVICPDPTVATERQRARVKPWLPVRSTRPGPLPEHPIGVYPVHSARRISTQRSNFTIHGSDIRALEKMTPIVHGCLGRVTIPSTRVVAIRRELECGGIDESTAYPDLAGLGRTLCLKWRQDTHNPPHQDVYTRLRPSPIHGVGVFAIRPIKKGMRLFAGDNEEMLWVHEKDLPKGPKAIRELYDDFAPIDEEGRYGCPKNFNRLTMSWYINEPKEGQSPNVRGDPETYDFQALRDIAPGEELTVDYDPYTHARRAPRRGLAGQRTRDSRGIAGTDPSKTLEQRWS